MNDNGPKFQNPKRIIVHSMAEYLHHNGQRMHAPDFITSMGWSVHAYVCPDGQVIRQRRDDQGAWHAKGFNTDSLGVEILVAGEWNYSTFLARIKEDWCDPVQFYSAAGTVCSWAEQWGISTIDRHSDVDPSRKFDPGAGFDWERFLKLVWT